MRIDGERDVDPTADEERRGATEISQATGFFVKEAIGCAGVTVLNRDARAGTERVGDQRSAIWQRPIGNQQQPERQALSGRQVP